MNGRAVALALCVLATVVGCSAGETEEPDPPAPIVDGENLTGAEVCEMVPEEFVRDRLEITLTGSRPTQRDTGSVTMAECHFEMADKYDEGVSVGVMIWPGKVDAKERVRLEFTSFGTKPRKYEEVDGLGDAAGFGPNHDIKNYYTLHVVNAYEQAYRTIHVNVVHSKPPTLEQVRPIAERLLEKLDG